MYRSRLVEEWMARDGFNREVWWVVGFATLESEPGARYLTSENYGRIYIGFVHCWRKERMRHSRDKSTFLFGYGRDQEGIHWPGTLCCRSPGVSATPCTAGSNRISPPLQRCRPPGSQSRASPPPPRDISSTHLTDRPRVNSNQTILGAYSHRQMASDLCRQLTNDLRP